MTMQVQISDGTFVLVDDEDYEYLMQWKWSAHSSKHGYAMRGEHIGNRKYEYFLMHRVLIEAKKGECVDHINGDTRDNRKENLRIATKQQNSMNVGLRSNNTSGYKGVTFDNRRNKWVAAIKKDYKSKFLGYFENKDDAAMAYNEAALKFHGEFANLNKILGGIVMSNKERKINVLDKGYVRHLATFGSDLDVVNNARASYDKESKELTEGDKRLIAFLARENHMSPFRSPRISFEVYAPLVVARQWWRYAIDSQHIEDGTPWSESSRRYITEKTEFYLPGKDQWRSAPANSKQGSGAPLSAEQGLKWTQALEEIYLQGEKAYEKAMEAGIAAEQARLFLPAYGLMVRWRYTASLQSICHFLNQRLKHDAQKEIYDYAVAVLEIVRQDFPVSAQHLLPEAK